MSAKASGGGSGAAAASIGLPDAPLALAVRFPNSRVWHPTRPALSMSHPRRKNFQSPDWGMQKISISSVGSANTPVPLYGLQGSHFGASRSC